MTMHRLRQLAFVVATVATIVGVPARAVAQPYWLFSWSAIGAGGVVDESSMGLIAFDGATASLPLAAAPGSNAVMRFALPPMPRYSDQWVSCSIDRHCAVAGGNPYKRLRLTLRFRKNDESAWVMATLRRVRHSDGVVSNMAAVNSLSVGSAPFVQLAQDEITCADTCIDPSRFAYFIEVPISKWAASSVPQVVAVQIELGYD